MPLHDVTCRYMYRHAKFMKKYKEQKYRFNVVTLFLRLLRHCRSAPGRKFPTKTSIHQGNIATRSTIASPPTQYKFNRLDKGNCVASFYLGSSGINKYMLIWIQMDSICFKVQLKVGARKNSRISKHWPCVTKCQTRAAGGIGFNTKSW